MAGGTRRLFFAVDPGEACRAALTEASSRARAFAPRCRWAREEGTHVTLVFLGDVDEALVPDVAERASRVAVRHAPLTLRFEGAGCFGARKPRVLWVGVEGDVPALGLVQKELSDALAELGFEPEERVYSPHLTLARAGFGGGDTALFTAARALAGGSFGEVRVEHFVLYESELGPGGARYRVVERFSLSGL